MGLLDRFRRSPSPEETLREQIAAWVLPGFTERSDVLEWAIELSEDDDEPISAERIEELVDEIWNARLTEQNGWSGLTDSDLLELAFARLEHEGVIARMNFACCQNCGSGEIIDERRDQTSTGYVFFHQQDAERLADPDALLYLAYGAFDTERDDYDAKGEAIGRQVVAAITEAGLPVSWNGSINARIEVGPLTWCRRLPTEA